MAGYDYFYRQEGQKGHLWEMSPTLYLPMNLGPYVQVTPQAGFRESVWDRSDSATDTGDKRGSREVFQIGGSLSTEIYRVYDVGGASSGEDPARDQAGDHLQLHPQRLSG